MFIALSRNASFPNWKRGLFHGANLGRRKTAATPQTLEAEKPTGASIGFCYPFPLIRAPIGSLTNKPPN